MFNSLSLKTVLTAEIKKQERVYSIREGNFNSPDFADEPLKEYYEKNKEKFFRKEAIKASMVQVDYSKFKEQLSKLNVTPELTKFIASKNERAQIALETYKQHQRKATKNEEIDIMNEKN